MAAVVDAYYNGLYSDLAMAQTADAPEHTLVARVESGCPLNLAIARPVRSHCARKDGTASWAWQYAGPMSSSKVKSGLKSSLPQSGWRVIVRIVVTQFELVEN